MTDKKMTYAGTGVNYDAMDPFKRKCQIIAQETSKNAERFGIKEIPWSKKGVDEK